MIKFVKPIIMLGLMLNSITPLFASCLELLKLESKIKSNQNMSYISGSGVKELHETKRYELLEELQSYKHSEDALNSKKLFIHKRLMSFLSESNMPKEFLENIEILYKGTHDPAEISEWAQNLYYDAIVETHLSGNKEALLDLSLHGKVPDSAIIDVLVERAKDGGFSGNEDSIQRVHFDLSDEQFGSILETGKLILDLTFTHDRHGHLVHMFQVDYFIYLLKKMKRDPSTFVNFYKWIGQQNESKLSTGETFDSLSDVWGAMFDSFESDISNAESFNLAMKRYINWSFKFK